MTRIYFENEIWNHILKMPILSTWMDYGNYPMFGNIDTDVVYVYSEILKNMEAFQKKFLLD